MIFPGFPGVLSFSRSSGNPAKTQKVVFSRVEGLSPNPHHLPQSANAATCYCQTRECRTMQGVYFISGKRDHEPLKSTMEIIGNICVLKHYEVNT